jgi:hypothetical protein
MQLKVTALAVAALALVTTSANARPHHRDHRPLTRFLATPSQRLGISPYQFLCLVAELPPRHLCENAIALALAACVDPDLGGDHRDDANDLRLSCETVWVKIVGRPGEVVVHAVEAEPEEMLGLLRRTPPIPAGRLVGAGNGWQARDGYDVTVLIDGPGLSQLAHRGACHRSTM